MKGENKVLKLHDRATRGQTLTAKERETLEAWYESQDVTEAAILKGTTAPGMPTLQSQIDIGLAKLRQITENIQSLSAENERLQQEITGLYHQLKQTKTAQIV